MRRFFLGLALAAVGAWAPSAAQAGDLQTAQQIAENLRSGGMKYYSVGVGSQSGVITLRGSVANENQRALALAIAQNTQGVAQVVDELQIGEPAPAIQQTAAQISQPIAAPQTVAPPVPAPAQAMRRAPVMPVGVAPSMSIAGQAGMASPAAYQQGGAPIPAYVPGAGGGAAPAKYDQPHLPRHAWPAYAAYPNYGAVTYPKQYSPTAWPYIGPFYPYPQVPLGWRKVTLEWDDGWWMLDFKARRH
ncbi:MAG: BON domain-containing protein [Pirellulales bacterium]